MAAPPRPAAQRGSAAGALFPLRAAEVPSAAGRILGRTAPRPRTVPPARGELERAKTAGRRGATAGACRYGAAPFAVALGLRLRNAPAVGIRPLPISVMPPASLLPLSGMGSVCRTLGRVASDLAPKLGHIGEDVSLPPQFVGDHRRPD